jgi:hypothetical protein
MFELRLKPERLTREIVRFLDEVFSKAAERRAMAATAGSGA